MWLRGLLEVDEAIGSVPRPDKCGVIFGYQPDSAFGEIYTAWEVEPGAATRGRALEVIEGLAERFSVMMVTPDPDGEDGSCRRRFVGP